MKFVEIQQNIEEYCHCPSCDTLISDNDNIDEFINDDVITCPSCGEKLKIIK